jgi:hypothetical protein
VISYASAQMDLEDARLRAQLRREFPGWTDAAISEAMSADVSAPHPDDVERDAELLARGRELRAADRRMKRITRGTVLARERGWA